VKGAAKPLPSSEKASVPATAAGNVRYLFALPEFRGEGTYDKDQLPPKDVTLTLTGASKPASVKLMGDGKPLDFEFADNMLTVKVPAGRRTKLVDVAEVELPN
jgi:alpha-L-fucosidase